MGLAVIGDPVGQAPDPQLLLPHEYRTFVEAAVVAHHQVVFELDHAGG